MISPYRSTPVFDETSLPAALRNEHSTKAGVWGLICVIEGQLRITYLDGSGARVVTPDHPAVVEPQQPHFVEPMGAMKMRVDFYNEKPI